MPQKLQNIAKTLWLVFQREWMFGKGREILVGSEGQQNSTQSLRRNVRTWCVLFVCSIHFLFAMFAFFIYGVHFFICSSQFFSLQRFLFIRSDRLLFAAITFLFAAFFFILSVHCFSLIIFKLSFLSLQFTVSFCSLTLSSSLNKF